MAMVSSQLRPNAVNDPRVVTAMAAVPRHAFLPEAARALAYRDTPVPLGGARSLNTPIATGRLLTEAYLRPTDRALLIGAATGYAAAVLAALVSHVVAVEQDPELAAAARAALESDRRVTIVEGELAAGHADGGPYDVLIVDGAVEALPDAIVDQLTPEARAAAGLVDRGVTRLASGRRGGGELTLFPFADIECVILPGFAKPRAFAF